jgi:hypothetical protein
MIKAKRKVILKRLSPDHITGSPVYVKELQLVPNAVVTRDVSEAAEFSTKAEAVKVMRKLYHVPGRLFIPVKHEVV